MEKLFFEFWFEFCVNYSENNWHICATWAAKNGDHHYVSRKESQRRNHWFPEQNYFVFLPSWKWNSKLFKVLLFSVWLKQKQKNLTSIIIIKMRNFKSENKKKDDLIMIIILVDDQWWLFIFKWRRRRLIMILFFNRESFAHCWNWNGKINQTDKWCEREKTM